MPFSYITHHLIICVSVETAGVLRYCVLSIVSEPSPSTLSPKASPSPPVASSPGQLSLSVPIKGNHHRNHLSLVPALGIVVTVVATMMLVVLIFLIRGKSRELKDADITDKNTRTFPQPTRKYQEGILLRSWSK